MSSQTDAARSWVPGTIKLYVNNVLVQDIGQDGLMQKFTQQGVVSHVLRTIGIYFNTAVPNGHEVKIEGKRYLHGRYHGYFSIIE